MSDSDPRPSRLRALRILIVTLLAAVTLPLLAGPARAHGASGQEASNYLVTLTSPPQPEPGLVVRLVESGSLLQLTSTEAEVVVAGHSGEPYLRVGPDGVFTNRRSPSSVWGRSLEAPMTAPPGTDPAAEPDWVRTSDGPTARWFDSRARWTATSPPPEVVADPQQRHVVSEWTVPVTLAGAPVAVAGTVEWVPGPSALPWWLLSLVIVGVVAAGALFLRTASRPLATVTALCVAVSVAHSALSAADAAGGPTAVLRAFLTGNIALLAGWGAGVVAVVQLWRDRPPGVYVAAFAGAVVAVLGGLLDAAAFGSSQVPVVGPAVLGRLTTALSLGLGVGLVVAAVTADERVAPAAESDSQRPSGAPDGSPTRPGGSTGSAGSGGPPSSGSRWDDSSATRSPSTSSTNGGG